MALEDPSHYLPLLSLAGTWQNRGESGCCRAQVEGASSSSGRVPEKHYIHLVSLLRLSEQRRWGVCGV